MSESFLSRVTRYPRSPDRDPRENRLTECLAAVLSEVEGLASRLLSAWAIPMPSNAQVVVRTQPMTQSGYFIDLEIRCGPESNPLLLAWVEIKHGSGLGETQLERYTKDLRELRARRRELVLLAPPRFKLEHELPVGARRETWATVADVCAAALSGLDDPVHRWLVQQLLQYLQEEGLSQSSLTPDDINVLPASIRAFAALDGLIELTAEAMEDAWGPRLSPRRRGQTIDAEFTYEPRPRAARKADSKTWQDSRFHWAFTQDDREDDPYAYAFCAYAWLGKKRPELKPENRRWQRGLAAPARLRPHA